MEIEEPGKLGSPARDCSSVQSIERHFSRGVVVVRIIFLYAAIFVLA